MKKIIGIIFVSLMFANIGFAKITGYEVENIRGKHITTICVDGYKFVTVSLLDGDGISIAQIFEERSGKSLPVKC